MPIYSVQGPDGRIYDFEGPAGLSEQDVLNAARRQFLMSPASSAEKPESGFVAATKAGFSGLKSDIAALAGRTGLMAPEEAEKYIEQQKKYQAATFKPTETWGEAPITKGLELLGGSLPYMAAPVAAGLAPGAVGLGLAGAASAAQFTGSNISRQMQEGKQLKETELGSAALAAVPQAALDMLSFKMMPGIRGIMGAAGKEVSEQGAKQIAEQALSKVAIDYTKATGKAMAAEGLTEAAQQVLERMQAGLNLTDEKARDEYWESLVGGAVLGGVLAPAGRYMERRGEAKKETGLQAEIQKAQADAEAAKAAEEARKASPDYAPQFVADYEARRDAFVQQRAALKKPGNDATPDVWQAYKEQKKALGKLEDTLKDDAKEYNQLKAVVKQQEEKARLEGLSLEEWQLQQLGVKPEDLAERQEQDQIPYLATMPAPVSTATAPVVDQYVEQTLKSARAGSYLPLTTTEYVSYLMQNPGMAAQITPDTPMPGLSRSEKNAVIGAIGLQLQDQARQSLVPRVEELAGQVPKKVVGKRKAPDYEAYLQDLEAIDFDRREGQTASEIAEMERGRIPTGVSAQAEMFGTSAQRTVLGEAPKTRRELLSDLRIARSANNRDAAGEIINKLRALDTQETAAQQRIAESGQKFVLNGEEREALSSQGYTEDQIDDIEVKARKSLGQALGAGQTPLSVALQQAGSENRADAFAEVVDLVNRFNRGAAKQEQLDAAKERYVSNLLMDIRQSRAEPLSEDETRGITRNANELLRELVDRFGDTRTLSQKGKDLFVPAQTRTGEFRTDEVPGTGYPTVESRAPGRQTFASPFAAAQSIREGLEDLRTKAIAAVQPAGYTTTFTPREVSADAVETQLSRELAKDPQVHSREQRRLLEAIADNVRMMMRPETRQNVSDWLYDLARDPNTVAPDKTQSIRDALQTVEQAKRSETEIETREFALGKGERVVRKVQPELPFGPARALRQPKLELEGPPKKPVEGAYSQISAAPTYEAVTAPIFNNYAELRQYLASDALQELRSAIGLGRPTVARLEQRVKPFLEKVNAAKTKVEELSRRAQQLESSKRKELQTLKEMSAADAATEARALTQAKQQLDELRKRMAELEAPLVKELQPLIKELETAQRQFTKAVEAEEKTLAAMLNNTELFENREIAAIQKLQNAQERMKRARSKLYKDIEEDFGQDPRNLARMMREFKESGKQGAFNEQINKARAELDAVFFDTRKDDAAIQQYLKTSAKLSEQLQAQANAVDALAVKLLDAGIALETVRNSQLDVAENRDEILDARAKTQEAQQALRALETKQQERLAALEKIEADLGLTRTEIPHRISETTTVAEVLRAANASEKDLIGQLDAAVAELNEAAAPVKSLRSFDRQRAAARAKKPETAQQTQDRDAQRQRLLEAIGRDSASFEGQRISFEKRRKLIEELGASEETQAELEALIAAADEAAPYLQERISEAEKAVKSIDKEIAQVEAANKKRPRSFIERLEQKSAMVALEPLRDAKRRFEQGIARFNNELSTYAQEKATAESNLRTLGERRTELQALFSNDPEISAAIAAAIDKRIAKVEKNIANVTASLKEKGIKKETRESRQRELRKYNKELRDLMTKRSAKFGIARTELAQTGRLEGAAVEAGARLEARKVGPAVRPVRTAGNIRTGELTTTGERKLSTRSKITQSGKPKELPVIEPVEVESTTVDRIMGEMDALERVRQTAESRRLDAQEAGDIISAAQLKNTLTRIDTAIAEKQKELDAAQQQVEQPAPVGPTNETVVREQLKTLSADEVAMLEEEYGVKKRSKTFIAKLSADIVDMVNNGGKAVARGIRKIVKKMSEGVLAAAMIFNPQFNATNFSFDLPKAYSRTITETVNIKAEVPAAAREKMSPLAQMVYENMAPTAKASGKGFGIVDKVNGAIHFFNNDGSLLVQGPALMGKDVGDVLGKSSLEGGPKITPAGRFTLEVSKDDFYGTSFNLLETRDSTGYVAIHPVYLGNLKENRLERLQSPEATDNRISYGCINTTKEMFVDKLAPNADSLNGGMLFIMPDVTERTAEMFPAKVETVTKTLSGTEQTAKVEGRSIVGREEKRPERTTLYQIATEINNAPRVEVDPQKSAASLMEDIATTSKTPLNRAVAERLKNLLGNTKVYVVKNLRNDQGGAVFGAAAVDGSHIALDADSGQNEQTILHEGVHAATERVLRSSEDVLTKRQLAAKRELESLYDAYAADAAAPNDNAKESLSEFVSDALSDPVMQRYMQGKKWTLKNMWTAFKNSILNMIGVDTPSTMLEATLAAADALMLTVPRPTRATTERLFQQKPKYASPEMAQAVSKLDPFITKQRGVNERVRAAAGGFLGLETQLVDRFAGFERLRKYMPELQGTQMIYYLRMYDQRMNMVSQAVGTGAPTIVEKTRKDGKVERVIEAKEGPSIKGVVDTLKEATPMVGNGEAVNRLFTAYMAAIRADNKGFDTLNFGEGVTQAMLNDALQVVERNDKLKKIFDKARGEYNEYNRNLINFLVETGAVSKKTAAKLTAENDYIPFYRERNGVAELLIGNETPIRIGSIKEQPYLQELVGGDRPILDFMTSSVQNTNMLIDMGMRNLATKNAVFELLDLSAAKLVKGTPDGPDVVKFKVDGEDRYAVLATEKVKIGNKEFDTGVPADILVKGMEGIPAQMPFIFRALAIPAQILRKGVTLSPMYIANQLFRDSLAAPIAAGADFAPVLGALKEIGKPSKGVLERRGITGGQQFTGGAGDLSMILRGIADGKPGWMSALAKAEAVAMSADSLTRRAQYNSYIEQGLSEMEATLMALESMNFNKRGTSPSIHVANALIPFFNAQIQGLNVLYKAMTGQMPFNDKLKIRQKLLQRGGMMAAASIAYALLMQDDEAYKNAEADQKYGKWFVRIPGVDEPVRVSIPFEIGYIFKALPEALVNTMLNEHGGEEAVKAFKQIVLQTIPGGSSYGIPQALKPAIEAGLGKSFYTGRDILSAREKGLLPEEQFRANTTEMAKLIGQVTGTSPVILENLVRGYTGTVGLAFMQALSMGVPTGESPEKAVKRLSEYPIIGGAFQPNDAGGITNSVYERMNDAEQVGRTYKKMVEEGRMSEAKALLQRRGTEFMQSELAKGFKQNMNQLIAAERAVQASRMSPEEKRAQLDQIRKLKIAVAKTVRDTADKTTSLSFSL